jgi:hypothetical protein
MTTKNEITAVQGRVTADVNVENKNFHFDSPNLHTKFYYVALQSFQIGEHLTLNITIPDTVSAGTYDLNENSAIQLSCIYNRGSQGDFVAESGSITILENPAPNKLNATFNFKGRHPDGRVVEVRDGVVEIPVLVS